MRFGGIVHDVVQSCYSAMAMIETWWRVVVDSKFGSLWDGWHSNEPLEAHGVGLWKNIRRGVVSFQVILDLRWEMNLRSVSGMIYGGDKALKEGFPVLCGIACAKDALVMGSLGDFMVLPMSGT
jgi:hypothetical protein